MSLKIKIKCLWITFGKSASSHICPRGTCEDPWSTFLGDRCTGHSYKGHSLFSYGPEPMKIHPRPRYSYGLFSYGPEPMKIHPCLRYSSGLYRYGPEPMKIHPRPRSSLHRYGSYSYRSYRYGLLYYLRNVHEFAGTIRSLLHMFNLRIWLHGLYTYDLNRQGLYSYGIQVRPL